MPKYFLDREVKSAHGSQTFSVEANSLEEAKQKFEETGGEYELEEVEVTRLSPMDLDSIYSEDA